MANIFTFRDIGLVQFLAHEAEAKFPIELKAFLEFSLIIDALVSIDQLLLLF
jgi:hypothetical protein